MTPGLRCLPLLACALVLACSPPGKETPDAGNRPVIGMNCGDPSSPGNSIGVGKYCKSTDQCPVSSSGTTMQCSTVLTNDALPLLCSRLCGAVGDGGQVDCGPDAVCHNIKDLGYDLIVCVPYACDALFDGGLPRNP